MTETGYQAHDAAVRAEHERAIARGEERILYRTDKGMLHSYAKDEIGGPPNSSRHWWSMLPASLFFLAGIALDLYVLVEPTFDGGEPWWRALWGMAVFAPFLFGCLWSLRKDYRAHRNRKQRGVPEPLRFPGATTTLPETYTESDPMPSK
jgi:hypothetical protein